MPLKPALKASLEAATARYERDLEDAADYLAARGFNKETAEGFRLGVVAAPMAGHEDFHGRLAIPSIGPEGDVRSLRFRALDNVAVPRYLGIHGQETRLFNPRAVVSAGDRICITEGEFDCMTLVGCGFPACGVTGATSWKKHYPRVFAGFATVYVLGDGDKAGREFARTVAKDLPNAQIVPMPEGADVNSLYVDKGEGAIVALLGEAGWE